MQKPETSLKTENKTDLTILEELLKASIFSAYLKPDKAFSVIIIGEPELNKTRTLMKFSDVKLLSVQSDLTYWGIIEEILPKIANGQIKTLLIPDLLKTVMKRKTTSANFVSILNAMIEEGVYDITIHMTKQFHGARANLITSVTPKVYFDQRGLWSKIGFYSRIIPFTFGYNESFIKRIFSKLGKYEIVENNDKLKLELPNFPVEIEIEEAYCDIAELYAKNLAHSESIEFNKSFYKAKEAIGFRHKRQFQSMLKSFALMRNSNKVEQTDVDKLKEISRYMNYDFNVYEEVM